MPPVELPEYSASPLQEVPTVSTWPSVRAMRWGVAALLGLGVVLRLVRYFADRSLWLDEAYLTINLMTRSYGDLLETLDYNQGAPLGFLWIEKLMLSLFGDAELVLRLFPLAVSLLALVLFYLVARDVLAGVALLVALLLFATMEPFVRYAAEVKQYGLDIGVTVALLLLFVGVVEHGPTDVPRTVLLALAGPLAVFLSHPSVFVLTGMAAAGLFLGFRRGATTELRRQLAAYGVWVAAFAVAYLVAVRDLEKLRRTVSSVGAGATGGLKNLYTIFNEPGGMPRTAVGLAAAFVLVGAVYLWRRRPGIVVLGAGTSAALLAAGLVGAYPVGQRFLVFLLPVAVLFLAEGVDAVLVRSPRLLAAALVAAAVGLIALPVVGTAASRLVAPPGLEEIEPLLAEVADGWRDGDVLVLYPESQYAFRYYQECDDCSALTETIRRLWPAEPTAGGQDQSTAAIISQTPALVVGEAGTPYLDRVDGRGRVWFLATHFFPATEPELLEDLDARGERIGCSHGGASLLCLYDFAD
jgi:hypothetical protein